MPKRDKTRLKRDHRTEEEKAAERARVYAMLYAKLHAPPAPPLDAARKFLRSYFNEPEDDPREEIAKLAAVNTRSILAGLAGIEALLAEPPTGPYVLQNLVWREAGQEEDGLTEERAVAWLRNVAEMVREVLGDKRDIQ